MKQGLGKKVSKTGGSAGSLPLSPLKRAYPHAAVVGGTAGVRRGYRPQDPRKGVWRTPDWLFQPLNTLLRFDLDAAADKENAKCRRHLSQGRRSALLHPWEGESVWCNPPYGQQPGTDVWVEIGRAWAQRLRNRVTMLLPVKADTAWYHDLVWGQCRVQTSAKLGGPVPGRWYQLKESWGNVELLELRGRVDFGGATGPGFFASAVVLYNAGPRPVLPQLELLTSHRVKESCP